MKKVKQICKIHKSQDNIEFYNKLQFFFFETIQLFKDTILTEYEKIIIDYAFKMYLHEYMYNCETFKSFRIIIAKKQYSEENISVERKNALYVVNSFLTPFEEYNGNDEIHRPYKLEYTTTYLKKAGISDEKLDLFFEKYFKDYFKLFD